MTLLISKIGFYNTARFCAPGNLAIELKCF